MKNNHPIVLKAANPLVVELDSEAHAAYVRFSKKGRANAAHHHGWN
ncbi:MAG: hypothetical protein IH623_04170 [Verrucomicrobia bacterium]|nr:hypothetical protein [Verrucomicrobiota bacterium]